MENEMMVEFNSALDRANGDTLEALRLLQQCRVSTLELRHNLRINGCSDPGGRLRHRLQVIERAIKHAQHLGGG